MSNLRADRARLVGAALTVGAFTAALWWIRLLDAGLGWSLHGLGVRPGEWSGLLGVLTAPLVHGSFEHLVANTPAILVLGTLLLYGYPRTRGKVLALIWLGAGLGTWVIGRDSAHIGASGLTHGLMFFLFFAGMFRRDRLAIAFSMLAFFLYGGMVWGVFPSEEGVSWEAHLSGALAGTIAAFLFARGEPRPPEKRYAWEDEPDDAEDPVIGDQWRWRRAPPREERMARSEPFHIVGDEPEHFDTPSTADDDLALDDERDSRLREAPADDAANDPVTGSEPPERGR